MCTSRTHHDFFMKLEKILNCDYIFRSYYLFSGGILESWGYVTVVAKVLSNLDYCACLLLFEFCIILSQMSSHQRFLCSNCLIYRLQCSVLSDIKNVIKFQFICCIIIVNLQLDLDIFMLSLMNLNKVLPDKKVVLPSCIAVLTCIIPLIYKSKSRHPRDND